MLKPYLQDWPTKFSNVLYVATRKKYFLPRGGLGSVTIFELVFAMESFLCPHTYLYLVTKSDNFSTPRTHERNSERRHLSKFDSNSYF